MKRRALTKCLDQVMSNDYITREIDAATIDCSACGCSTVYTGRLSVGSRLCAICAHPLRDHEILESPHQSADITAEPLLGNLVRDAPRFQ